MRSRAEAWAGPLVLLVLIGVALWLPSRDAPAIDRTFSQAPSPVERDSLAALAAVGTVVRWRGTVQPVAMELDPDPTGAVRVAVVAPNAAHVRVADALGTLDSTVVTTRGAAFALHGVISPLAASAAGELLRASVQRSSAKSVAVFGPAGWEARFLMETVEASGLPVAARIRVGPQTWVRQGRPLPLDTARHSVALILGALDPPAAAQVRAFARAGGGVVMAPGATGLDDLAPGRFGTLLRPPASLSLPATREHLGSRPLTRLGSGAAALAVMGTSVKTAVKRVGAGRVVQLADEDTWRLVLASDAGRAAHSQLWLTAIAIARTRDVGRPPVGDGTAPRAALVAALGPASDSADAGLAVDWERLVALLLFATLVGEWALRRLGGKS